MAETTETTKKIQSRKFIVWLVWLVLCAAFVILNFVKDGFAELTKESMQDFFFISITYLGMNVASKGINVLGQKKEEGVE